MEESQTIWFPGIYHGRSEPEWKELVRNLSLEIVIERVQRRAQEDGEWAIDNGHVGSNEDKMRRMMTWVSLESNIQQAYVYIQDREPDVDRDVDYICRDLANGSKWAVK